MARERYQQRLERLREAVVAMGDLVSQQLEDAVTAFVACDSTLAKAVIDGDNEVNRRYLALEAECLDVITLHQPMLGDLRLVVAAFKIITDLERIGDLAINLAQYSLESHQCTIPDVDFERLTALAQEQVQRAIDAVANDDTTACLEVVSRDTELDRRCEAVTGRVLTKILASKSTDSVVVCSGQQFETNTAKTEAILADVLETLILIRDLERVGDHAVNVAVRAYYALEGDDSLLA
ncbi:phosphate signaling complex protein PhoU [Halobacteria archaeon AArc-curdl1]|uniref:Phosphate-specific transport system accessory protein PhoU n=1 Tax=Natronosalvus hydrolyticus TaxID=2979988 RepID=A0AAP2ZBT2_9EURY|nr:phosphate signaling complex protein PhoU [Halobacteria archaeon AArc-curdl1]